jgi:hypothetical protein
MRRLPLLFLLLTVYAITSCNKEDVITAIKNKLGQGTQNQESGIFKGAEVQVGAGKVRSFINLGPSKVPVEIGFEIDSLSLEISAQNSGTNSFIIPLHEKALGITPFDHLQFNWIPPEKKSLPNSFLYPWDFSFQFYTISVQEQLAIPEYGESAAAGRLFDRAPELPSGLIPISLAGTAQKGMTLFFLPGMREPIRSSDFHYGNFNKKVVFYAPTMNKTVLRNSGNAPFSLSFSAVIAPPGIYYPTKCMVYKDSGKNKYYVSFSGFVLK